MKSLKIFLMLFLLSSTAYCAETDKLKEGNYSLLLILAPALLPIIANYFIKSIENRNFSNRITRELDVNQKRMEFVKNYYAAQKEFLSAEKLILLRTEVADQLNVIKKETDDVLTDSYWLTNVDKLSKSERLFLTFTPASRLGWVWRIAYYLLFVFLILAVMGYAMDDASEYSWDAFLMNLQDSDLNISMFFFVCLLMLSRQLALWNYEEAMKKKKQIVETIG